MKIKAGDIIKVSRKNKKNYQYGLYIGQEEVIYYLETLEIKGRVTKTSLEDFRKKNGIIEVVDFPATREGRSTVVKSEEFMKKKNLISEGTWPEWFISQFDEYVLSTIWDTIQRAKSRLDKMEEPVFNNGEHFVWWCKVELKRKEKKEGKLDEFFNPSTPLARFPLSKKPLPVK
ncbi:lecithin retinol acyltransferase family protein [Ilyobacter polytropus]|uniref:LRAT domain-containing protein n=1 Tax=Ilyobacter polytropus (strain ATCC 51220 / DSM 2926 / LMG 16218 / CuHBu1) TaxID=572544 RepID=E3H776_ILYPC|nr:lecithin retinol acyltransferase family protein [Ilyobacter polytropus]ADO82557.1 hypothetical protein Ilyop_0771 [Ilyobacter polytropus DSM 2926]